jgi:histidinol-phosphate aminotransferase
MATKSLGRLNIAAASAALAHVRQIRSAVAAERTKWIIVLDELTLTRTDLQASFIFFNAGRPQTQLAGATGGQGVDIGRTFQPYAN